jgi:hypothetical protein
MTDNMNLANFEDYNISPYFFGGLTGVEYTMKKPKPGFFSIVDIIAVLTNQTNYKLTQGYWTTLKRRLKKENNDSISKCLKLKLEASDGKMYLTDVVDT